MTRVALAHAAGIAVPLLGAELSPAPLLVLLAVALFLLWRRPWPVGVGAAALAAGVLSGTGAVRSFSDDCRLRLPLGWEGTVEGRFLTRPGEGSTYPFRIEAGAPEGCRGVVRAIAPRASSPSPLGATAVERDPGDLREGFPRAGERIRVSVRWEGRRFPEPGRSEWAGLLFLAGDAESVPGGGFVGAILAVRGRVQERIAELFGARAPIVEALVLSRMEHIDPALREAFGLSGTAHILSISGFHVGVVAGILLGLLRWGGVRPRPAAFAASTGCWAYVLAIGAPHAAVRAALLLTLLVGARLRGYPVVGVGALSSALLLLLVANPEWLASIGFQLSFAGTAGLVLLRPPVERGLAEVWRRTTGRPLPRGTDRGLEAKLLKGGATGVAAGVAATLPTLPLLAWHFDQTSLIGIPATLAIAPPISAAIPGIGVSLLLSALPGPLGALGAFVAGGTGILLAGVERAVVAIAALPGASLWVSRSTLLLAIAGGGLAHVVLRERSLFGGGSRGSVAAGGRVRPAARRMAVPAWGAAFVLVAPLLPAPGHLAVHLIDVGQGDAIALEFPGRRWILVDAGPRSDRYDAGARRVVPYLKRHGAREIEVLVLTHPHLDHIGGAAAVLENIPVVGILDPAQAFGSSPYLGLLEEAGGRGVSWWSAEEGRVLRIGEARVTVLHPGASSPGGMVAPASDPNDVSVVLLVEWEGASILLTGDAPAEVEERILREYSSLTGLTVLKLGHHGSRTSTSSALLQRTRPRVALAGVGEGNSFGHPHEVVTDRLEEADIPLYRTDRDGDVRVRIRPDGSIGVRTSR